MLRTLSLSATVAVSLLAAPAFAGLASIPLATAAATVAADRSYVGGNVVVTDVPDGIIVDYPAMKSVLDVSGALQSEQPLAGGGVRLTFSPGASTIVNRGNEEGVWGVVLSPRATSTTIVDVTSDHLRVKYAEYDRMITVRSLPKKVVVTSEGWATFPTSITMAGGGGSVRVERYDLGPVLLDTDGGALTLAGGTARLGGQDWELGGQDWDRAPQLGGQDWDVRIPATRALSSQWENGLSTQWQNGAVQGGLSVAKKAAGGVVLRVGPLSAVYDSVIDLHDIVGPGARAYRITGGVVSAY